MALIGTISGSNGTTTSAVTGSLIIAADPTQVTSIKPADVVLYVSGSATSIGSDSPSILFKGDSFISGALGTDSYFQMKPVNILRVPTNTTASYIYTSGSTNDMYFTQYSGPYTNTTRLRWMESQIHTGLLHGGIISAAVGGTTFSVTEGEGIIVAQNAFTASSPYPTITDVKWNAVVSQSLTYVATNQITYLGVNASGNIFQQITPISLTDDASYISLGRVLHQTGSVVNGSVTMPIVSYGGTQFINDFVRAIGPLKVSGHVLAASGSTLSITKTSGVSYVQGRNYTVDPNSPDVVTEVTDTPVTVSKIFYQHVSGSTIIQNTGTGAAGFTVIDPTQYNSNGTLTALSNNNKISVQRVYWYPNSVTRAFTVYYGNAEYDTLDAAQAGITTETFTEGNNTVDAAILVAYLLVQKNCASLADTATSRIVQAGTFRGTGIGGGGGTASSTTPGGLDTYVQFNDGGSTFGGDAGLTYNKTTDTLTITGDIAVNGGDITTTAGTFNIANSTATTVNLGGGASAINIGAAGSAATFAGNVTGSRYTSNAAGSLVNGNGQVYLNGASSNRIDFSSQGTGDPAFNAPTAGTKVVLYPAAGASATDYALGISPATLWQSLPQADSSMMFKWYGGTTILAALSGSGNMQLAGDFAVNGGDITTTAGTFNIANSIATTVNLGGAASTVNVGAAGSSTTFAGNISGSNALLSGDLAVNGGDITTTSATFNLVTGSATTVNIGGTATTVQVGAAGSSTTFAGNITGSNARFNGDIAVNGGDITSTAGTFNIAGVANVTNLYGSSLLLGSTGNVNLSGSATVINAGASGLSFQRDGSTYATLTGDATTISIGATPSRTTANFFNGNVNTLNIAGAGTAINIGAGSGRTSIFNDLVLGTGNVLVTNDGTPITLISSGNILAKLDINNNGTGHKFDIQDYNGISQFFVGENGSAELSGSLVISGSTTLGVTSERMTHYQSTGSNITFDMLLNGIFYVNNPTAGINANFTNAPVTGNRIITPTVILSQSATPQPISTVLIDGASQVINWANGTTPTPTANKQDVYGFSLIRSGSAWKVLGQLSTYG